MPHLRPLETSFTAVLLGLLTVFKKYIYWKPNKSTAKIFAYQGSLSLQKTRTMLTMTSLINSIIIPQCDSIPTSNHRKKQIFIFKKLKTCSHVFLRVHAVKPSWHTPYTGFYGMVKIDWRPHLSSPGCAERKTFWRTVNNTISISTPAYKTHSRRHVYFPKEILKRVI